MCSVQRLLATLFTATLLLVGVISNGAALAAATTPTSDFTDNRDGTVTHKTTGLTWKRCAEGQSWTGSTCSGTAQGYTWDAAMALGSDGWGLPTLDQLKTIVEIGHGDPTINQTVFPNTPATPFWSATAWADSSVAAWYVDFNTIITHSVMKTESYYVRLVRGGQSIGTSSPAVSTNGATTPASTASSQEFSVSATASGDITRQTLQGRVNVHPSDIGSSGAVFVVATPPGLGTFYHGANGSWSPSPQTYFRGTLANTDIGIVESPTDLSALGDTKVYLGYGRCLPLAMVSRCYDDMNSNGTVHLAHTVPLYTALKGQFTVTTYTEPSTNGSVAALASVTSAGGQQITYWGLKDKSGKPFALTESLLNDPASGDKYRTLYGAHGLPKQITDLKTGETIIIRWGMDNAEFRFYDANRKFVLGFNMAVDGAGEPTFTALTNDGRFAGEADADDLTNEAQLRDTATAPVTWLTQLKNKAVEKGGVFVKNTAKAAAAVCAVVAPCEVVKKTVTAVAVGVKIGTLPYELQNNGGKGGLTRLNWDLSDPDNPGYVNGRDAWGFPILPVTTNQKDSAAESPSVARAPDAAIAALQKIENPPTPASTDCPSKSYLDGVCIKTVPDPTSTSTPTPTPQASCPPTYKPNGYGGCVREYCPANYTMDEYQRCIPIPLPGSTNYVQPEKPCDSGYVRVGGICTKNNNGYNPTTSPSTTKPSSSLPDCPYHGATPDRTCVGWGGQIIYVR